MRIERNTPSASGRRRRRPLALRLLRFASSLVLFFMVASIVLVLPLRWLAPPTSSFILQRALQAAQAGSPADIHYHWIPYRAISPHMKLAAIAGEDQKFPLHGGFDFTAIRRALEDKARGQPLRGASTISQQVAKNLYLWPARSLLRKGLEAWFTMLLELLWPKQRILEIYLNIVELGEHTFGVEAASRRFFRKSAGTLNRQEAALLAAVLPNPSIYHVAAPSAKVRNRQAWILRQMRQLGGSRYLDQL